MSRDATGIYSAWATQASTCPVCRAGKGERCDLDVPGEHENGTHWERTETAPPWPPASPERSVAWDIVALIRGERILDENDMAHVDAVAGLLKDFAARAIVDADAPLRAMQATQAAAAKRIRDAFQETYGAFWKCARCGGYIGSRPSYETTPPGYVCPYCGSMDNLAHGYTPPPEG